MMLKFKKTAIYRILRNIWFYQIYEVRFNFKKAVRLIFGNNKLGKIKKLKNKYEGERCFIIATGPSMTKEDLVKLKYEYTFGCNSLAKIFPELGWETTFFGIQDQSVYKKLIRDIQNLKSTVLFISNNTPFIDRLSCDNYPYELNIYNQKTETNNFVYKFSDDPFKEVCGGFTIVYSLLQIAVYLGFKEIYLLGCDCNYDDDKAKRHFIESGHYDPGYKTVGLKMIDAYKVAKQYADNHGVKIYNATRGGMLEVFKRVDLDEVLN